MSNKLQEQRNQIEVGDTIGYEVRFSTGMPPKTRRGEVLSVLRGGVRALLEGDTQPKFLRFADITLQSKKHEKRVVVALRREDQVTKGLTAPLLREGVLRVLNTEPAEEEPVPQPQAPESSVILPPAPVHGTAKSALDAWLEMGQEVIGELRQELQQIETDVEELQIRISDIEDKIAEKQKRAVKLRAHLAVAEKLDTKAHLRTGDKDEAKKSTVGDRILDALRAHPHMPLIELTEKVTGLKDRTSQGTVRSTLSVLAKRGAVVNVGFGRWEAV